jgi:hypothetical protein
VNVPSVEAKVFSSRRNVIDEVTKRTPATFIAASLAARSSATLSATGTVNGSTSMGLRHSPLGVGVTGASVTGRHLRGAVGPGLRHGLPRGDHHAVGREVAGGGEAPGAVDEGAHAHAGGLVSVSPCTRRSRVKTPWARFWPTRTSA